MTSRAHRKQGYKRVGRSTASVLAAPNILDRNFQSRTPEPEVAGGYDPDRNRRRLAAFGSGDGYLLRKIVGWSMATHKRSVVAQDALKMAIARRKPAGALLHHSDLGSQYTDKGYRQLLTNHCIICSMSAAGSCYDNAMLGELLRYLEG